MHLYGWYSSAETCSTVREVLINLICFMLYMGTSYENVAMMFLICRYYKNMIMKMCH